MFTPLPAIPVRQNSWSPLWLARLRRDARGNTLAMTAAALIPIAGMIGSGLDMSRAYLAKAKMQNACDTAALAARRAMIGTAFDTDVSDEGDRFFTFNFPDGTMQATSLTSSVTQDESDLTVINVTASADIPTTLMSLFGIDDIPISVACSASHSTGPRDIMLVLDVTTSMDNPPDIGGADKIDRLRDGAIGIYNAIAGSDSVRIGIMPYSRAVNVGRDLRYEDIARETYYFDKDRHGDYDRHDLVAIDILDTEWAVGGNVRSSIDAWRTNGEACVEERSSSGNSGIPIRIVYQVSEDDINAIASSASDTDLQWGRYDRDAHDFKKDGDIDDASCPAPASRLQSYTTSASFVSAINNATADTERGTYHNIGLIWGLRYLSPDGLFAADNPDTRDGGTVERHLVFLTDGQMSVDGDDYTTYGVYDLDDRIVGGSWSDHKDMYIDYFLAACSRGKAMDITIWVIALDTDDSDDISPCATSDDHFYESDGSDLEDIFEDIGTEIGNLRLTN